MTDKISAEERRTRIDLAASYRLTEYYGMADMVGTHISARIPGEDDTFLLNPHGMFFDEITASSLVKVNMAGDILSETNHGINAAGFTIHSAVLGARPDVNSVSHTHTQAGMAVSCMDEGLLPLTQHSIRFFNRVSYHDYEGVATDLEERARLAGDLGATNLSMILRNHGLLTCGRNVAEAFNLMFYLEKSCKVQVDAMAMKAAGGTMRLLDADLAERVAEMMDSRVTIHADRAWPGHLRRLDRISPDYKH